MERKLTDFIVGREHECRPHITTYERGDDEALLCTGKAFRIGCSEAGRAQRAMKNS